MQKRIFITLLLCLSSVLASAQNDNGQVSEGSFYSQFGVGVPVDYGSPSADGMGLWGVSYMETLEPNVANPALWGSTVLGKATGGIEMKNFYATDNSGSANHSLLTVNNFQLQLPIYKGELGVSASFTPYTETSFEVMQGGRRITQEGTATDTLNFETVNVGDGGINQLELGVGWRINNNIAVGYAASLVYASIDDNYSTVFDDASFASVNTTYQTSGSGFGNRFGALFTIPSLARENDRLNLGVAVRLPVKFEAEKVQESQFVSGDPEDSDSDVEARLGKGDIRLPLGLTAGLTYAPSERLAITTEGRYEQWSKYVNELEQTPANIQFSDRFKIGAGLRYFPFATGSDRFLSQFKYRLGASYDSGHLKINGENIDTIKLSAGIGIISPTRLNNFRSSIDLSFYYGIRGTKSMNLVKENIWGVKLSLNLAELFFFRPKLQ